MFVCVHACVGVYVCVCVIARAGLLACSRHHSACAEYSRVSQKVNDMLHNFSCKESTRILIIPGNLSPSGYQCRRLEENLGSNKFEGTWDLGTVVVL